MCVAGQYLQDDDAVVDEEWRPLDKLLPELDDVVHDDEEFMMLVEDEDV